MRDQGSVGKESPEVKYDRALALFTESVMEPNHQLRGCAHNQGSVSYTHLTLPTKRIV